MSKPFLKLGASGEDVKELQAILIYQGCGAGELVVSGYFDELTEDCVRHFQATHIDENGEVLEVDGKVGKHTWWALYHPVGEDQRNFYSSFIPKGIRGRRKKLLQAALKEHDEGVCEVPDGSNWGDGVVKYGGQPGWPWCCLFTSWVSRQAFNGKYPLGYKLARCWDAWHRGKKLKLTRTKKPIPGDQFIMLYKNRNGEFTRKGHTGFVLAVSVDGKVINTVEGNCSNRVKIGRRPVSKIHGFIDFYPSTSDNWQRGLTKKAGSTEDDGTR